MGRAWRSIECPWPTPRVFPLSSRFGVIEPYGGSDDARNGHLVRGQHGSKVEGIGAPVPGPPYGCRWRGSGASGAPALG